MSFEEDLQRGAVGEYFFSQYFKMQKCEVKDYRDDVPHQQQDIDFTVDGVTYEVKTDYNYNRTGNFVAEDYVYYWNGGEANGWLRKTKAEFICFCNPKSANNCGLHIIRTSDLKKILNRCRLLEKPEYSKISTIYLIHLEDFSEFFESIDCWVF